MKNIKIKYLLILGSSKQDGKEIINKAVLELSKYFYILRQTEIIKTKSYMVDYTEFFFNQALIIETSTGLHALLKKLNKIEYSLGQKKKNQLWGDRIIDIDIIYAQDLIYYDTYLNIPHESIYFRDYVKELIKKIGWGNEKF